MKKQVSNSDVVKACKQLVRGYKNDTLDHATDKCPLCKLFYNCKADGAISWNNTRGCNRNCPNQVFEGKDFGCLNRCYDFKGLDWNRSDGTKLMEFWKRVGDAVEALPEPKLGMKDFELTVDLRVVILDAALEIDYKLKV